MLLKKNLLTSAVTMMPALSIMSFAVGTSAAEAARRASQITALQIKNEKKKKNVDGDGAKKTIFE